MGKKTNGSVLGCGWIVSFGDMQSKTPKKMTFDGKRCRVQFDYLVTRPEEKFSKENGLCQAKNYGFVN